MKFQTYIEWYLRKKIDRLWSPIHIIMALLSFCTFLELVIFNSVIFSLNYPILVCRVSVIEYIITIYFVGRWVGNNHTYQCWANQVGSCFVDIICLLPGGVSQMLPPLLQINISLLIPGYISIYNHHIYHFFYIFRALQKNHNIIKYQTRKNAI